MLRTVRVKFGKRDIPAFGMNPTEKRIKDRVRSIRHGGPNSEIANLPGRELAVNRSVRGELQRRGAPSLVITPGRPHKQVTLAQRRRTRNMPTTQARLDACSSCRTQQADTKLSTQ